VSLKARQEAASLYSEHIIGQWLDRQYYWRLHDISYKWFLLLHPNRVWRQAIDMANKVVSMSWVCCIIDGMDQAKFKLPHIIFDRKLKVMDRLQALLPQLQIVGNWLHGFELAFAIMNANMPKPSDVIIEIISQSLNRMYQQFRTLPRGFHLQADNAPNNMKNRNVLRWMIIMVLTGIVRWFSVGYLRKAHTHEDIDHVFAQLTSTLANSEFNTPSELVELMQRMTRKNHCRWARRMQSKLMLLLTPMCATSAVLGQ